MREGRVVSFCVCGSSCAGDETPEEACLRSCRRVVAGILLSMVAVLDVLQDTSALVQRPRVGVCSVLPAASSISCNSCRSAGEYIVIGRGVVSVSLQSRVVRGVRN